MYRIAITLLGALGIVAASANSSSADCRMTVGTEQNICGTIWSHAQVAVIPTQGSVFDYYTAQQGLPVGPTTAYATMRCKQAGVSKILYSGTITKTSGQFTCGTGDAAGYPLLDTVRCGTTSSCL
jgi:hypothetical protein